MPYALVIAGLNGTVYDRVAALSANRLAPDGAVVAHPNRWNLGYARNYAAEILAKTHKKVLGFDDADRTSIVMLYVDYRDETTQALLQAFFPFCLPYRLNVDVSLEGLRPKQISERLNVIAEEIVESSTEARRRSRLISEFTNVANLTPLLLPRGNYRSATLSDLLGTLYEGLATNLDPRGLIEAEVRKFVARNPRVRAPGDERHCYSDGHLYFRSPGRARHGFYRRGQEARHGLTCLLNARSRLGGKYDPTFHYDCVPTHGRLHATYSNCHAEPTPPKSTHVNIAPNDFII